MTAPKPGRGARGALMRLLLQEDLNFLLTNRLPRRFATKLVGRVAAVEHPLVARPVGRRVSSSAWKRSDCPPWETRRRSWPLLRSLAETSSS